MKHRCRADHTLEGAGADPAHSGWLLGMLRAQWMGCLRTQLVLGLSRAFSSFLPLPPLPFAVLCPLLAPCTLDWGLPPWVFCTSLALMGGH